MGSFHQKIAEHTKQQQVQILDLLDKDFNSAIINKFKELKEVMPKELKKSMKVMS